MQIRKLLFPALVLGAALAQPARAQTILPLSFEARGGVAIPTGDFADGAGTGFNVGATVHYRVAPMVSVYAGYEYVRFAVDSLGDVEGVDAHFIDQGFRAGARFEVPLAGTMTGLQPWVEGGATFNQTTVSASNGSASVDIDADRKVGFEVGAGLNFAVAPKISIAPGVRYHSHKAEFDFGGGDTAEGDVNYFTVDLGVHIHL
ncbi:Outer membrane protein beta-barrel domain-containing protein [bacterium JGI 053]|nr:Outer membrane protein beta-barrel domain-containing protein [bacterium JGI 053]